MGTNYNNYQIITQPAKDIKLQQWVISLVAESNGKTFDFTGDNNIVFPDVVNTLTNKEKRELMEHISRWLVPHQMRKKLAEMNQPDPL